MKENTTSSVALDAQFGRKRALMQNYGSLLGQQVYAVTVSNIDPEWKKKKDNGDFVSINPLKIYGLQRITVVSVSADTDGAGNLIIIFNEKEKDNLRFPVMSPELRVPSIATVRDAIRANENHEPPIFFKDCAKVTAEITSLNKLNVEKALRLSREMAQQAEGFSNAMELDRIACEKYLDELNSDLTVSITVEE